MIKRVLIVNVIDVINVINETTMKKAYFWWLFKKKCYRSNQVKRIDNVD